MQMTERQRQQEIMERIKEAEAASSFHDAVSALLDVFDLTEREFLLYIVIAAESAKITWPEKYEEILKEVNEVKDGN